MKDWFSGVRPADLIQRMRAKRSNSPTEDLEDAVQDVYLKALEKARSHDPPPAPVNPDAYLMRSVHNRLNSMQRSRWREVHGADAGVFESADGGEPTPAEVHEARERAELFGLLAEALRERPTETRDARVAAVFARLQQRLAEALTPRHWILIRMRVLDGAGFAECADQLGVSIGTAHSHVNKALGIVREALEAYGVEAGTLAYPPSTSDDS